MDVKNKKYEAFMRSHRHWRHHKPRAKIAWSEDKKRLQKHLVEAARLLARLGLPFASGWNDIREYELNPDK